MQRGLAHDAAATDVVSFQFKLRLDQDKNHTVWSYQLECVRQDQSQRDKRYIDNAKIDRLRDMLPREKSGVQFLHDDHPRIITDFPRQLVTTNVHRVNLCRAALQ